MPTFNANKPAASESPALAPAELNDNFAVIEDNIEVDHEWVATTPSSNAGKHNKSTYIEQDPIPSTSANEFAMYSLDVSGVTQLQGRRESDGAVMTFTSLDTSDTTALQANGYTSLPGGLLLQYGIYTAPSGTSGNLNFPKAFSAPPYSVQVTIIRASGASSSYDLTLSAVPTASTFKTNSGFSGAHSFYMVAIGPA